jgi:hypothetical protein
LGRISRAVTHVLVLADVGQWLRTRIKQVQLAPFGPMVADCAVSLHHPLVASLTFADVVISTVSELAVEYVAVESSLGLIGA